MDSAIRTRPSIPEQKDISRNFYKKFLGGDRSISDSESLWSHFFFIMIGLWKVSEQPFRMRLRFFFSQWESLNNFKNIPLLVSDRRRATSFHNLRSWWFRKTWDSRIVTWPFSRSGIHFPFVRQCNIFITRCRRTQSTVSCLSKIHFRLQDLTSGSC